MAFIVEQDGYQYGSLALATVFLVPQIVKGYKTQSLKDVSALSLTCVTASSFLWGFYMYETDLIHFACATGFVGVNALSLLSMKVVFYYKEMNDHYKSFGKPPTTCAVIQAEA
mgnify:CR=1 FL=1